MSVLDFEPATGGDPALAALCILLGLFALIREHIGPTACRLTLIRPLRRTLERPTVGARQLVPHVRLAGHALRAHCCSCPHARDGRCAGG